MESTETGSADDSLDARNLEDSVEDLVVTYGDSNSADHLSSQNEEGGGEQVYGYLEVESTENASVLLNTHLNFNGQSLFLTHGDEGNEIIVFVNQDDQPLALAHNEDAHASVILSDEVNFEDDLKEQGALVVNEQAQDLQFMKEEVSEEHEERHVYIENSDEILNISTENQGSPVQVSVNSPVWSVSNNGQLKNDSTEMLFIPNPTVVLAPEETKHRKLMQLACIAHELQSADQKSSATAIGECTKNAESSIGECENPVKVIKSLTEEISSTDLVLPTDDVISDKCLSMGDKEKYLNLNSKTANIISSVLACTSSRIVDNTVSVIHSTSSEVQENSLENQIQTNPSSDFSSDKNLQQSEIYSNKSNLSFHGTLDESSSSKQIEEVPRNDLEESSRLSIPDVSGERSNVPNSDSVFGDDESPITFIEKSQELDVDTLGMEDNPVDSANADMRGDDDSQAGSSILVVEDDESKGTDNDDSNMSSNTETKDSSINQRTSLQKNEVPKDANSSVDISDIDDTNNNEDCESSPKNELSFFVKKYNKYSYKSKTKHPSPAKNPISSPVAVDDKASTNSDPYDMSESETKQIENNLKVNENSKSESMKFENSPSENGSSDLVIAENVDVEELNVDVIASVNSSSVENMYQNLKFRDDLVSKSTTDITMTDSEKSVSVNGTSKVSHPNFQSCVSSDTKSINIKESNNDTHNLDDKLPTNLECNQGKDEEDFSSNEETSVKPPIKTYIKEKNKKNTVEGKSNIREKIELFSGEDFNFTECDKEINEVEACLSSDQQNESASSSQENNTESDDLLLLSNVQSKVSATYNRKKKSVPLIQGLRSRSLRPRSLPSSLPLKNKTPELSNCDSKKNSFDSNNLDNMPWGDVLLKTSFQPCNTVNDTPSTSSASKSPKETSIPVLSPEQRRRKLKSTRDFERLLNSPSGATKQLKINKKRISRGRKKVRVGNLVFSSAQYSGYLESHAPLQSVHSARTLKGKEKGKRKKETMQVRGQKTKEAKILYLHQEPPKNQPEQTSEKVGMYSCSSCNFSSIYVDNLMEHLKYCPNRQPVLDYKVNDMDKRQRIRGEEEEINNTVNSALKKIGSDMQTAYLMDEEPSMSFPNQYGEEDRDSDNLKKRRKYGYGEDDVVWVKFKDRFWPALVCDMKGLTAYVKLISYPEEVKGLKVKHENIRTFDNSKWNLLCLEEAKSLPNHEIFVKAVQSSERFISKKFLGDHVTGKEFFSVRDEVDFATDSASSDSIVNEDSDYEDLVISTAPPRKARYEKLDIQKIHYHILEGKADDYVLDIYHKRRHSKKHSTFFETDNSDLKHRPWFGPFEDMKKQDIFRHFQDLFTNKIGIEGYIVSYICQVWIPEAIVQAISVVQGIPLEDAEILFESEDSLDLEHGDPSIEEILKTYS